MYANKIQNEMKLEFDFDEVLHGFNSSLQKINDQPWMMIINNMF